MNEQKYQKLSSCKICSKGWVDITIDGMYYAAPCECDDGKARQIESKRQFDGVIQKKAWNDCRRKYLARAAQYSKGRIKYNKTIKHTEKGIPYTYLEIDKSSVKMPYIEALSSSNSIPF